MSASGYWFDSLSSTRVDAEAELDASHQIIVREPHTGKTLASAPFEQWTVSSRLGNTPRFLGLADAGKFETRDNDTVDQWIKKLSGTTFDNLIHTLESRWQAVIASIAGVVLVSYLVVAFGIPGLTNFTVKHLPAKAFQLASQQTLQALDHLYFEPTQLSEEEQNRVLAAFEPVLESRRELDFDVQFRSSDAIGANAFALPDGTIIFTDEMVRKAEHLDELVAILAHEMGHVVHRHGMKQLVRSSLLSFFVIAVTGDVGGAAESLFLAPVYFSNMAYARGYERQADDFAYQYLTAHDIDPHHFASIMTRLQVESQCRKHRVEPSEADEQSSSPGSAEDQEEALSASDAIDEYARCRQRVTQALQEGTLEPESEWENYASSHPATAERIAKFKRDRSATSD